jgi:hypothetical protein
LPSKGPNSPEERLDLAYFDLNIGWKLAKPFPKLDFLGAAVGARLKLSGLTTL